MPEIKNTFLKSRMNKDTEARILPQGEYRDAQNASVSASEDASVGSLENIRGNKLLTDLGLTDFNIEIIGQYADVVNNRIFFFLTNFTDASADNLSNLSQPSATNSGLNQYVDFVRNGASNYIAYCQLPNVASSSEIDQSNIKFSLLVSGTFLNFSKTQPISGINIIENLLFWTDNRNQPRKINVDNAIANPLTYYTNEDHISVAKYAPYEPISFLKNTTGTLKSTLLNEAEEWLPPFWGAPGQIFDTDPDPTNITHCLIFNENTNSLPDNESFSTIQNYLGTGPFGQRTTPPIPPASETVIRVQNAKDPNGGYALLRAINTGTTPSRVFLNNTSATQLTNFFTQLGWETNSVFLFSLRNPDYNTSFSGDRKLLEDKFVRFSYRFKYDDNEYSLTAPFTQHAFVPKQYGYFIQGDDEKTKASSIVEFMENQITTVGLVINLPYKSNEFADKLKVSEIQLLYKASDDSNVKVIADVKTSDFDQGVITALSLETAGSSYTAGTYTERSLPYVGGVNTNNTGSGVKATVVVDGAGRVTSVTITASGENYRIGDELTYDDGTGSGCVIKVTSLGTTYIYNYSSEKPIKVLTDEEVTRVSDIIPMRAQTQEAVGNRVVYGNFLQNNSTPLNLDYKLDTVEKGSFLNPNTPMPPPSTTNKEFLNNTLKQNRSYQVGIVLQDRYGRASNVIINQQDLINKNSTIFAPYSNGGINPLAWPGDSLKVTFNSPIPSELLSSLPYNGLWKEGENPLGWYTYKIVVQQQEQDYYNVYVPGALSGNIVYNKNGTSDATTFEGLQYSDTSSVTSIALFNDNINKIPRDLKEVGPTDNIYGSSIVLYNRVKQTLITTTLEAAGNKNITIGQQNTTPLKQEVTTVRPFNELGDWTTKKNIDLHYANMDPNPSAGSPSSQYGLGSFIYPGEFGDVDPFFLRNNKNPLIATISTKNRMGLKAINQRKNGVDGWKFADKLMVFETEPFKSNIDIYYETSTVGLISELNSSILTSFDSSGLEAPFGLSPVVIDSWFESSIQGDIISNIFEVNSVLGTSQIGANALSTTVSIVQVTDANNPVNVIGSEDDTTNWPVAVEQVSQVLPLQFRITCAKRFVYNNGSDIDNKYNITFEISTNTFPSVQVTVPSFQLTNIAPTIYRISGNVEPKFPYNNIADPRKAWIKSQDKSALLAATKNNPIPTVVLNNTGIDYNQEVNAIHYSSTQVNVFPSIFENICRFSHVTNGFDPISIFNSSTDSNALPISTKRLQGISYNVVNATRYNGQFQYVDQPQDDQNGRLDAGEYYIKEKNKDDGRDVTNQFDIIEEFNSLTQTSSSVLKFDKEISPSAIILPDLILSPVIDPWKKSWIYVIDLIITDAGGGSGSATSSNYTVNFLVTTF